MQTQYPFRVVGPMIDGDLLAILAQTSLPFTTGQLRRMINDELWSRPTSLPVIREALERLTAQGIVTKHTDSIAPVYRFNEKHLAADPIRALAQLRTALLNRLGEHVTAWSVSPVYGALFGSAATGRMRVDSDVDVLLVHPDGADPEVWERLCRGLEDEVRLWTGNPCHVLSLSESEAAEPGADRVLQDVAESGLTFAGPPSWLRTGARTLRRPR